MSAKLVDSQGNPINQLDRLIPVIVNDVRHIAEVIGQMQRTMLMMEIKVNFLVKTLQDTGAIPEDVNDAWQAYSLLEMDRLRAEAESLEEPEEVLEPLKLVEPFPIDIKV